MRDSSEVRGGEGLDRRKSHKGKMSKEELRSKYEMQPSPKYIPEGTWKVGKLGLSSHFFPCDFLSRTINKYREGKEL